MIFYIFFPPTHQHLFLFSHFIVLWYKHHSHQKVASRQKRIASSKRKKEGKKKIENRKISTLTMGTMECVSSNNRQEAGGRLEKGGRWHNNGLIVVAAHITSAKKETHCEWKTRKLFLCECLCLYMPICIFALCNKFLAEHFSGWRRKKNNKKRKKKVKFNFHFHRSKKVNWVASWDFGRKSSLFLLAMLGRHSINTRDELKPFYGDGIKMNELRLYYMIS